MSIKLSSRNDKDVIFRRIKGRIVPIKTSQAKRRTRHLRTATLLGGASAITGLGGGLITRSFIGSAANEIAAATRAKRLLKDYKASPFTVRRFMTLQKAMGQKAKAIRKIKFAKKTRFGAFAVSGAFAAEAIQSALRSRVKDPTATKHFAITTGSIVAGGLIAVGIGKYGIRLKTLKAMQKGFRLLKRSK